MGQLSLSSDSSVYVDANILIYSVERIQPYVSALDTFWQAASEQQVPVLTSELSVLEMLVDPLKAGNAELEALFRRALFSSPDLRLMPLSLPILERAARLRVTLPSLKTPDALHAATALEAGCELLLSNDAAFQRVPGLRVTVLSDLLTP